MFREIVDTFMQLLCHLGDVPHVPQLVGLDVRQQAVADVLVGGAGCRPVAHHLWARIFYKLYLKNLSNLILKPKQGELVCIIGHRPSNRTRQFVRKTLEDITGRTMWKNCWSLTINKLYNQVLLM